MSKGKRHALQGCRELTHGFLCNRKELPVLIQPFPALRSPPELSLARVLYKETIAHLAEGEPTACAQHALQTKRMPF